MGMGLDSDEMYNRMEVSQKLHTVSNAFRKLEKRSRSWNEENVKSWKNADNSPRVHTIGRPVAPPQSAVRQNRGGVKTVRSAGGLPLLPDIYSANKRPLADLIFINDRRKQLQKTFKEQKKRLSTRKAYEVEHVFKNGNFSPRFGKLEGTLSVRKIFQCVNICCFNVYKLYIILYF